MDIITVDRFITPQYNIQLGGGIMSYSPISPKKMMDMKKEADIGQYAFERQQMFAENTVEAKENAKRRAEW